MILYQLLVFSYDLFKEGILVFFLLLLAFLLVDLLTQELLIVSFVDCVECYLLSKFALNAHIPSFCDSIEFFNQLVTHPVTSLI